jgi:glucokinase
MVGRLVPVLEMGGTHVTAALVDVAGWRVAAGSDARRDVDAAGSTDEIVSVLVETAASLQPPDRSLWGVALPGPFDYARGIADYHGVGKFDALRGVALGELLRPALGDGISFVNDAEAFALGEWVAGAAQGHSRAVCVTLGTGVGSTFLVDDVAQHQGPGVPPDGRLDLLEVNGRPLEDTVSRRAVRGRYATLTGSAALDVREIAALARSGDAAATRAMAEPLRVLGDVLAPRVVDYGATILVVGGSIALAWDVIEGPLMEGMSDAAPEWSRSFAVSRAQHIEDAALIGAAWHALNALPPPRDGAES